MCGRFDTSGLSWAEIHAQLSGFAPVRTAPLNLEPNPDVRPTTRQVTARLEDGAFVLEPMRWSLIPFFYKGRVKPSAPRAGDGFKLTTFNCRTEPFTGAIDPATGEAFKKPASFKGPFERRRCIVPAAPGGNGRARTRSSTASPAPTGCRSGSPACGRRPRPSTRASSSPSPS